MERRERSEVRGDYGSVPLLILSGPEGKITVARDSDTSLKSYCLGGGLPSNEDTR